MNAEIPRTITIFLTTGNPNGIKKLEVSNRTIRAYVVPRLKIAEAKRYEQLTQAALYLLFDQGKGKAYVGECENFLKRIKEHDAKEFWDIAVAFIDTNKSLDKGSVKYLESLAIEASNNAGQMETDNKVIPPRNNLHEFKVPTIIEFFEDVKLLTSTLGFPLFDRVRTEEVDEADRWYCRGRNTVAKGVYSEEGFTILSGSIIDATTLPSFVRHFPREASERSEWLGKHNKRISDTQVELTGDITFKSVSRASGFCLGRASNGWVDWKNSAGKTMDEVLRKAES